MSDVSAGPSFATSCPLLQANLPTEAAFLPAKVRKNVEEYDDGQAARARILE